MTNPLSLNKYTYALNNPLIYVDPSGYITVGLRDSLDLSRGDSISWDSETRTAIATINGVTQSFNLDSDQSIWIENGRIMMNQTTFYERFGFSSQVVDEYIYNNRNEIGYAKDPYKAVGKAAYRTFKGDKRNCDAALNTAIKVGVLTIGYENMIKQRALDLGYTTSADIVDLAVFSAVMGTFIEGAFNLQEAVRDFKTYLNKELGY